VKTCKFCGEEITDRASGCQSCELGLVDAPGNQWMTLRLGLTLLVAAFAFFLVWYDPPMTPEERAKQEERAGQIRENEDLALARAVTLRVTSLLDEALDFIGDEEETANITSDEDAERLGPRASMVKAERLIREALTLKPDSARAYWLEGVHLDRLGKTMDAIEWQREALRLDPNFAPAHNSLGLNLARADMPQEAIEAFRTAIRLDPSSPSAHSSLDVTLHEQGEDAAAVESFHTVIRLDPNYIHAHYTLGLSLRDLRKRDEAIESFRTAIRLDPNDAYSHSSLGVLLFETRKYDAATESLGTAIRLDPELVEPHRALVALFREREMQEAALAAEARLDELEARQS
jgi:tetratricopeptide (TPR) repeat protein